MGGGLMAHDDSAVEACRELFARYPVAIIAADRGGTSRTMVLMLRDGDDTRLFILTGAGRRRAPYSPPPLANDRQSGDRLLFGWRQDDR